MDPIVHLSVRSGRVVCGAESEPIPEGRHPRVAAVALCERLYGTGRYNLHEHNPWQYSASLIAPPTAYPRASVPASGAPKSEDVHP